MNLYLCFGLLLAFFAPLSTAHTTTTQQLPESETGRVAEVKQFLQSTGLTVKNVARSHWEGTFKNEEQAAFIETDKGVVEAVIFSEAMDPFKLRITSQVAKNDRRQVRYLYKFEGLPTNGEAANVDAAYPLYFTIHQNWLLITMKSEVETALKAKIHGKQ